MTPTEYDLIVIGAGPVGENVADRAHAGGLSVVIVESELIGGDCSYFACVPSKALLRPGSALRAAKAVAGSAQAITGAIDVGAVLARRNKAVGDWDDTGGAKWLADAGIDLVRGHGRVTGVKQVTVTTDGVDTVFTARHAVAISTGSAALLPDIPGLATAEPWTSREATSTQVVPDRLVILGGGVVASEMASAFTDLGSHVTVLSRSGLLGGVEEFAGEAVADALRSRGAEVHTGAQIEAVHRSGSEVVVSLAGGAEVRGDEVLVATGRVPRTMDLGLGAIGLTDGDWLTVDDTMLVDGFDWLYAVGDVNHRVLLTHQGKYQARAAGDVIAARANGAPVFAEPWGQHVATADKQAVPQVIFTDPEVAAVGLTERAARKAGYRVRAVDYDIGWVQGAVLHADGYEGTARMVVDEDRKVILGVTLVGPDVAELIHAATVAIVGEVPLSRLWHAVPSFPTISEVWLRLLEAYGRDESA